MKRLGLAGRLGILAAMAAVMGHAPAEAQDILDAAHRRPRDPPDPKDPKSMERTVKTAADLDVELPRAAPVQLETNHAMAAVIKAKMPQLNRKQRRRLQARMQIQATNSRLGVKPR